MVSFAEQSPHRSKGPLCCVVRLDTAGQCVGCQELAANRQKPALHRWEFPAHAWQRLHVDFAGPIDGWMLLIVVDAFSKWPEVLPMKRTIAEDTVEELRDAFARFGVREQLVSDHVPQFVSDVLRRFMAANCVRHITGAPYHPTTNGLAERLVQTFKKAVKADKSDRSLRHKLARFLFAYRTAPHATTEKVPASTCKGDRCAPD